MILSRHILGDVLRDLRTERGMTMRDVSKGALMSLGYLSEVERGVKEASSETLAAIAGALDVPLSSILIQTGTRLIAAEELDAQPLGVASRSLVR